MSMSCLHLFSNIQIKIIIIIIIIIIRQEVFIPYCSVSREWQKQAETATPPQKKNVIKTLPPNFCCYFRNMVFDQKYLLHSVS